jgi:hypothetical protein
MLRGQSSIDDLENALFSGRKQMSVDPQGDRWIVVAEVCRTGSGWQHRRRAARWPSSGAGRALTRERIVDVAIGLLDSEGEKGLLKAATAVAVARAMDEADPDAPPREAIQAVALGVFDAIDAHPWIGGLLARPPWSSPPTLNLMAHDIPC